MDKDMLKQSRLTRRIRKTRGKGKRDRKEWALVSKSNPKKVLKWFGPSKPSKKQVAKEERRVHSFASSHDILEGLIFVANALDSKGMTKEADVLDRIVNASSEVVMPPSATGRNSAIKILLQDILRSKGYRVGKETDPENEGAMFINFPLDVTNNSWGKINEPWFAFATHVLRLPEIATQWEAVASTIGRGYAPDRSGMIQLLTDYKNGGRAAVGADLDTYELAEQTDEYLAGLRDAREEAEEQVEFYTNPSILDPEGGHPYAERARYQTLRERVEEEAAEADRQRGRRRRERLRRQEAEPESPAVASPVDQPVLSGVYAMGEWEQKRDEDGWVIGYKRRDAETWPINQQRDARGGSIDPNQRSFSLGVGGSIGERQVANINQQPLSENLDRWQRVRDE